MDWELWQKRWDEQQTGYMPDREQRLELLVDLVEAFCPPAPVVLDLAGGTGSITRRLLARLGQARSVVLDMDPALLAIAAGSFGADPRVSVVRADLEERSWMDQLDHSGSGAFDAVVTATALHWIGADRLVELYGELKGLLRPGGIFANADHMPEEGLEPMAQGLAKAADQRRARARLVLGEVPDWSGWWRALRAEPEMAEVMAERDRDLAGRGEDSHTRSDMPAAWHAEALRRAGFVSAGTVWRSLGDAIVVGMVAPAPPRRGARAGARGARRIGAWTKR